MLFIRQINVKTIDIIKKYFGLFFLLKNNDNSEISINNPKSINNGCILKGSPTVTPLNKMPFIKLAIMKDRTIKYLLFIFSIFSFILFLFIFNIIVTTSRVLYHIAKVCCNYYFKQNIEVIFCFLSSLFYLFIMTLFCFFKLYLLIYS